MMDVDTADDGEEDDEEEEQEFSEEDEALSSEVEEVDEDSEDEVNELMEEEEKALHDRLLLVRSSQSKEHRGFLERIEAEARLREAQRFWMIMNLAISGMVGIRN